MFAADCGLPLPIKVGAAIGRYDQLTRLSMRPYAVRGSLLVRPDGSLYAVWAFLIGTTFAPDVPPSQ